MTHVLEIQLLNNNYSNIYLHFEVLGIWKDTFNSAEARAIRNIFDCVAQI